MLKPTPCSLQLFDFFTPRTVFPVFSYSMIAEEGNSLRSGFRFAVAFSKNGNCLSLSLCFSVLVNNKEEHTSFCKPLVVRPLRSLACSSTSVCCIRFFGCFCRKTVFAKQRFFWSCKIPFVLENKPKWLPNAVLHLFIVFFLEPFLLLGETGVFFSEGSKMNKYLLGGIGSFLSGKQTALLFFCKVKKIGLYYGGRNN